MEIGNLIPHIEVLIFASDKPLTTLEVTDLINNAFGFMEDKITLDQVEAAIQGIIEKYRAEFYPFEIRESGGGWQFLTKKEYHKTIAQLNGDKFLKRLSSAAMETLSIIAYKQPVTKADIESIRGVSSDYAIQKLLEKELIVITGRNENLPGHPLVYATSKNFMDYFGLNSTEDLPRLKEVFDDTIADATAVTTESARGTESVAATEAQQQADETEVTIVDDNVVMIVGEDGNLEEMPLEHADDEIGLGDSQEDNEEEAYGADNPGPAAEFDLTAAAQEEESAPEEDETVEENEVDEPGDLTDAGAEEEDGEDAPAEDDTEEEGNEPDEEKKA